MATWTLEGEASLTTEFFRHEHLEVGFCYYNIGLDNENNLVLFTVGLHLVEYY